MKIIGQGAEAIVYLDKLKKEVIKDRISKKYRISQIDKKLRTSRTKAEGKILEKVSRIINSPNPKKTKEENKIIMPFIEGKKLSEYLNKFSLKEQKEIMQKIGKDVAKLHKENIIHGDLTTSNMIYMSKEKKVYFIDFGLGFQNGKIEDKGVDIHLLKQALEAKHFENWEILFKEFENSYKKEYSKEALKVFERLKAIEKRGRYRS